MSRQGERGFGASTSPVPLLDFSCSHLVVTLRIHQRILLLKRRSSTANTTELRKHRPAIAPPTHRNCVPTRFEGLLFDGWFWLLVSPPESRAPFPNSILILLPPDGHGSPLARTREGIAMEDCYSLSLRHASDVRKSHRRK